jgi:hypothetical protein
MSEAVATLSPSAKKFDIFKRKSRPTLRRALALTLELSFYRFFNGDASSRLMQVIFFDNKINQMPMNVARWGMPFLDFESNPQSP